jgi:hypothetical protein
MPQWFSAASNECENKSGDRPGAQRVATPRLQTPAGNAESSTDDGRDRSQDGQFRWRPGGRGRSMAGSVDGGSLRSTDGIPFAGVNGDG